MKTQINFIKLRLPALILSSVLILFGMWYFIGFNPFNKDLGFFTPKGLNLGIDFQGGLQHQVTVYSGISPDEIRKFSTESKLGGEVQSILIPENKRIGKETTYLIKTRISKEEEKIIENTPDMTVVKFLKDRIDTFHNKIKEKCGDTYVLQGVELAKANKINKDGLTGEKLDQRTDTQRVLENVVKESESVISPMYSSTLRIQALFLVAFVLAIMLLYVSFRFKFKYGIAALLALVHDCLMMLGFISIFYLEFDYTALSAILFILGYSINDTIVVFDRIRENIGIMKNISERGVINASINQTLARTIITSSTTLLAAIALCIWGGPKIWVFSISLVAGIISGTYSSIFIAAPIIDSWDLIFSSKKKKNKEFTVSGEKINTIEQKRTEEIGGTNISNEDKPSFSTGKYDPKILSKKMLKKISGKKKK